MNRAAYEYSPSMLQPIPKHLQGNTRTGPL